MSGLWLCLRINQQSLKERPTSCNHLVWQLLPAVYCVAVTLAGRQQALGVSLPGSIMTEVRGIMSAQRVHCSLPPSIHLFVSFAVVLLFCGALQQHHGWHAEWWQSGRTWQVIPWNSWARSLRKQLNLKCCHKGSLRVCWIGLWIMWQRHNPMHPSLCQWMTTWLFITRADSVTTSQLC